MRYYFHIELRDLYAGCDGSEKYRRRSHDLGFTNSKDEWEIWGVSVVTPGSTHKIIYLHTEHRRAVEILRIICTMQVHMGNMGISDIGIGIYIENAEALLGYIYICIYITILYLI